MARSKVIYLTPTGTVITASATHATKTGAAGMRRMKTQATVSAIGGTTPSFQAIVEGSIDGLSWEAIHTHTALTANGSNSATTSEEQGATEKVLYPMLRCRWVVSGTTPTGACTCVAYVEE